MTEPPPPADRPGPPPELGSTGPGQPPARAGQHPPAQPYPQDAPYASAQGTQPPASTEPYPPAQPYPSAGQQVPGQPYPSASSQVAGQPYPPAQGYPSGGEQAPIQPYAPVQQWVLPPKPEPLPVEPRPFHHFYRTPNHRWWKPILLLLLVLVPTFLVAQLIGVVAIGIDFALGNADLDSMAGGEIAATPALIAANNVGLALLIPAAMLGQWAVYRQRPRWLSSVQGGLRWRWLAICVALIVPIWAVYGVAELVLTDPPREGTQVAVWLTITVLTVPFQAAGEEYGLRGTVNRSVAAWIPHPRVALLVGAAASSLFFMSLHLATDPWLNIFYFGFGVIACVLCWRTGGLEAAVVLHVVNNLLAFGVTTFYGGFDEIFDRAEGTGSPVVLLPLLLAAGIAVALDRIFARSRYRRVTAPAAAQPPASTESAASGHP